MNAESTSVRSLDVELEERAELLSEAARMLPAATPAERAALRAQALAFLRGDIGEHIEMDEQLLFPRLSERLGDPLAAAPMSYEHRAIGWWIDRIRCANLSDVDELQRLLYGVHALIKVHLSREEDLYVGVLETPQWPAG
jgi:Hemerythrin HHE cation binding domain